MDTQGIVASLDKLTAAVQWAGTMLFLALAVCGIVIVMTLEEIQEAIEKGKSK